MHTQTHKHKQIAFNWCRCRCCEFTATLKYFPTATTIAAVAVVAIAVAAVVVVVVSLFPSTKCIYFAALFWHSQQPQPIANNPTTHQPNAPSSAPRPFRSFVQLATATATATATTTLLHSLLPLLLYVHCKKFVIHFNIKKKYCVVSCKIYLLIKVLF